MSFSSLKAGTTIEIFTSAGWNVHPAFYRAVATIEL
jgi:hypothetical protein